MFPRCWSIHLCKKLHRLQGAMDDEDFEIIAVEVKGRNTKFTWQVVGMYRVPNEDMRAVEILTARTGYTRKSTERSIIGGDLNLP